MFRACTATFRAVVIVAFTAVSYPEKSVSSTRLVGELSSSRDFAFPVAYDGGFFALWEDSRHGPTRACSQYGTRMTLAGSVVDPSGFRLSPDGLGGSDASGSCIGTSCLVAWQHHGSGIWTSMFEATTASRTTPVAVSAPATSYQMPMVATDGTQYLVVWVDGGIMGQLLTAGGALQGPAQSLFIGAAALPTVASSGSNFLLVWVDANNDTVNAQVLSSAAVPQGSPLSLGTVTAAYNYGPPVVGVVGTTYLVAWIDGSGRLAMRRVSHAGAALDATAVRPFGNTGFRTAPVIVADPPNFVLAWLEGGNLRAGRVRASDLGIATAEGTALAGASGWLMRGASTPLTGKALLTWATQDDPLPRQVRSTLLVLDAGISSANGELSQTTPDVHEFPRIARADGGFWVGYGSRVNGAGLPLARWVDNTGSPASTAPLALDTATADYRGLDFTAEDGGVRAVWVGGADVRTGKINELGQVSGPVAAGALGSYLHSARVAHLGGSSLLTWIDLLAGTWRISARLVDAAGGWVGASPFTIHQDPNRFDGIALVASNAQYGLAWEQDGSAYFLRLTAAGTVTGTPVGPLGSNVISVSVASDGADFLVAWSSSVRDEVFASRVNASGVLLDSTPALIGGSAVTAPGDSPIAMPEVTFDGLDYQLIWADDAADGGGLDVRMRRVSPDGGLGATTTIAGGAGLQSSPHVQAGSAGRLLTVWLDSDEAGDAVSRVRARAFADLPAGQPCLSASECRSGTCATVCCDVADGGCSGLVDAGTDGGPSDAGNSDAGIGDAGIFDAGSTDAGMSDAGNADAGMNDGGNTEDAGMNDGGETDAGSEDGGLSTSADTRHLSVGCGCRSAGLESGSLFLAALLYAHFRRRARQRQLTHARHRPR